ncbi:MAG: hypothetical protein GY808_08660 [Gammaproteobacteria bacterium]|nr:hypothetical protein [Gammaproteobacteria bacterium]
MIILLSQESVRDTAFISLFDKPRDIYIFSVLLHNEITKTKNNSDIEISIKELQETYKIFRGESKYDLFDFLNSLDNNIFSMYRLNKETEVLSYNIKSEYFDPEMKTFYLNVCLLKKLKINSQKIALYLISLGPHAKYLNLAFIATLLGIEHKEQKLKQKAAKTAFETLLKYHFIKSYNYDRKKRIFYFKMEDLKLKEIIQDLPDKLDFD